MSDTPDYGALIELLPLLRRMPDVTGETALTPEEAERIRSLGFEAEIGPWMVPPLPPALTRDTMWESLSAGWNDRPSRSAMPVSENRQETETNCRQNGEAGVAPQRSVEAIYVLPEHYNSGRQAPPTEHLDWKRIEEAASKILAAVERNGGEITRRRLQQKLWRYGATTFDQALEYLARHGRITLDSKSWSALHLPVTQAATQLGGSLARQIGSGFAR
jgi:hypothetical protein